MSDDDNRKMDKEKAVWEQLGEIFRIASQEALLNTVEAIASKAGVTQIEGFPVREFFERLQRATSERLIADFADTNPSMASEIKAALDKLDYEREDQSDT